MSAYKIILPLFLLAFVLTNCDLQDANVGTFEDAADKLPNFTVIQGAENVSVRVDRNRDTAYFDIDLRNIDPDSEIQDGLYQGYCAHWSAPINTNGQVYEGVRVYSTLGDENWNKLNYLLNHSEEFMNTIEGVTYKEIQAVVWELIDFKDFDVNENQMFDDLNKEAFHKVLRIVRESGSLFRFRPGMIYGILINTGAIIDNGEPVQAVLGKVRTSE